MSTHDLNVKLTRPSGVSSSAESTSLEKRPEEKQKVGSEHHQCLTGTSTEYLQTTKNLYIRRRILLRSKSDWSSPAEDCRETTDQLRFTSFLSLRFPSKRSETGGNTEARLFNDDIKPDVIRRPADVQHSELCEKALPPDSFREAVVKAVKDENVSEPPFGTEGTTQSHQSHFGHETSRHRLTEGIQRGVAAENCLQIQAPASDHLIELPATESRSAARESGVNDPLGENAEGVLSHSNLIPFGEDSGSKASANCPPSACSPRALKRTLSLPSFPAPLHDCELETEPHLIDPTTAMFTSTIVSVLAPHWSGRFRRHKRGTSEVEQDIQVSGQPASSQNSHQQPFLLSQMKPAGEAFGEVNSKLREPTGTSRNGVSWQKDPQTDTASSSHLTATFQTNRPTLLDTKQQTVDSNVEFGISDPGHMPRSPLSPHLSSFTRTSQTEDQGDPFSLPTSRPTTSSLLLYWRRLNSRKANAEPSEMEKQLAMSVRSLTLPSKSILKVSEALSPVVSTDEPTKDIFVPHTFPASVERLRSPEDSPVSPGGREMEAPSKSMFLSKREFEISSRTSRSTKEGLYSSTLSRPSQSEPVSVPQHHSKKSLERKSSQVGHNQSMDQSINYTNLHNSNNNGLHRTSDFPRISPKDNMNNNIGSFISHSYHNSDSTVKKHSQPVESTPNLSSNRTNDNTSNKANNSNTSSTSKNTVTYSSRTRPGTFVASPAAGLTSMSLTQTGLSTQNSVIKTSSLCPESLSPSPTNSLSRRTFTSSLTFSPRKEPSAVEGASPSPVWLNYLNSRQSQSNQSPSDRTSPMSPSRPLRRVHAPSIYSYLRETSPPITTRTSSTLSSPSPQTPALKLDGDQTQKEDKNTGTSRFTFDLSPVESQYSVWTHNSYTSKAPQSLPPDFGRRSGTRLSKSPYSTLISARPALNSTLHNLKSPPVSYQHGKSVSSESSPIPTNCKNVEKSMPKDSLIQGISGEPVGSSDKHLIVEKGQTSYVSRDTYSMLQSSPDAEFTDCQITKLIPKTTHPKRSGVVFKITQDGLDDMFSSQSDKDNTYTTQGLNYNKNASALSTPTVSEATIVPEEVINLHTHETLQGIPSMSSKKSLFSRSKKDSILTSSKEDSTHRDVKKKETTGPKSNRMDQVLNRLKSTFGVKRSEDDDFTARRKMKNFDQQSSELKAYENNKKVETFNQSQTFSSNSQNSTVKESNRSSGSLSGFRFKNKEHENPSNLEKCKRLTDENGNQFLGRPQSPNWPKPHYVNRYATMPQTRKTTLGPSLCPSEFTSKDERNDDVFYFPTKRKSTFVCKTENIPHQENALTSRRQHLMGAHLSASCADLMYGLERGRSVSVSSVVSGRPSGPGRISTGSRQGSVSDLTSLDEFVTRSRHSSISSPDDSPGYGVRSPSSLAVHSTYKGCAGRLPSNDRLWSPVKLETFVYSLDTEADPTPPPSPTFSPRSRRMSQIPSSSSNGSRTSQDSLSPRGFLPSRNYKSTLSVFEESDSDTTTDDEYYLNSDYDDDEKETEL